MIPSNTNINRDRKGEASLARRNATLLPMDGLARVIALVVSLVALACSGKNVPPDHREPQPSTAQQAATVDLDESYVVMGRKSVKLSSHTDVHSGNVGVSFSPAQYPLSTDACFSGTWNDCYAGEVPLEIGQHVDATAQNKLFGSSIRLRANADVYRAYYLDTLEIGSNASSAISPLQVSSAHFPLFPNLPTPPAAEPASDTEGNAGATIVVPKNAVQCLPPGTYTSIQVSKDGTLRFAANCATPTVEGTGAVTLRDLTLDQGARVHFNTGPVRMRDVRVGQSGELKIVSGTHHLRDLRVQSKGKLILGSGVFHMRNLRTDQDVKTLFMSPQQTDLRILNKAHLGAKNDFNSLGYESNAPVDASLIALYVRGLDGASSLDGDLMGDEDDDVFPPKPRAVLIGQHTKLHANIMALGTGSGAGGTIHLRAHSVGIGSYFADHVIVGQHADLTNRNGLVGAGNGDGYNDGDADNDSVADEIDNCLTVPNVTQVDVDGDEFGDACDNCPSVPNPRQERAYPTSLTDFTGAACVSPVLAYCGDGTLQSGNNEQCDDGFVNHGEHQPCSLYCWVNLPVITQQPQSQTVNAGSSVTFTVAATGHDLTYQWRKNGNPISGATSASYTIASVTAADAGDYLCAVSTLAGAVLSDIATLTVANCQASDATCDGVDDDCNGQVDEDYAPTATSCGVGACAATGQMVCTGGTLSNSCAPGTPAANDATCNGVDNDCNGQVDEDYAPTTTQCGVGACQQAGVTSCVAGQVQDSCTPGTPGANDQTCDGIDNDCDGQVDESYVPHATSCGVGACQRAGVTSCVGGQENDSCAPGAPAANDAVCDGVDADCNGAVDEDYVSYGTNCGVGACAATGFTTCELGVEVDSCDPGTPAANDATCNGIDDNCDGPIDEDYVSVNTTCGVGACAATGSTTCDDGTVIDSCDPGTPAAQDATCNGVDDDCSGQLDEDYQSQATSCGVGACGEIGVTACVSGGVTDSCEPGDPAANDALCNGVDDDCNGQTDEDYAPVSTQCGVGGCQQSGVTSCVSGQVQDSCTPGTPAGNDATCDGIDADCDGQVDEGYAPHATSCGVGACARSGVTSCVAGNENDSCAPGAPTANDALCDGIDNDCNGQTDEDYQSVATSCGVGACAASGSTSCVNGSVQDSCSIGAPADDDTSCDGIDDDCDGGIDEDYVSLATSCGVGACAASGATSCVSGNVVDSCEAGDPAASDATCDGLDDDCNGQVDEDYTPTATSCGVGACAATGQLVCVYGALDNTCDAGTPAANDASCNGVDDDCSGQTDEDYAPVATQCGVGACQQAGVTSCVAGQVQNSCVPGTPAGNDETCDGIDADCDGQVDEGYVPHATSCGVGACQRSGMTSCVAGQENDSCAAGTPAANDALCDGIDNDCNGAVDEDYVPYATSCGVGACARSGMMTCEAGAESDSCDPGTPAASDTTCDAVDDDCDGSEDDDYVSLSTSCGVGACAETGSTSCEEGEVLDSCEAGTPAANDATCNGIDDDCSGQIDEDYQSLNTSCGVGACADTGHTVCSSGTVSDTCEPGEAAESDTTCDGIDDDCDGQADEHYVPVDTQCGVGGCHDTGITSCVSGSEQDSCEPGTPAGDDATCDGIDADCDGQVDEEYESHATSCGVGACQSTGSTSCVAGDETDSCTPGTPAANDALCDGIDNDCSGQTDEDYVSLPTGCGVGACGSTGSTSCPAGSVVDSCTPGTPAANDALCDGIDNDCSGQTDEDYVSVNTSCGVGACYRTGSTSCPSGSVVDSCTAGSPAANDALCDGVDADCNGSIDEDYVPLNTSCGVGACSATGQTSCANGSITDSCDPGEPESQDTACDNVDEDCDGQTDEEYIVLSTQCGVGGCHSAGLTSCVDGLVHDSCEPGTPAGDDETCDGIDADCDGQTDEEYEPAATTCGIGGCHSTGVTSCEIGIELDSCTPGTPAADDAVCDGIDSDCNAFTDEDYESVDTSCGVGACGSTGVTSCVTGAEQDSCTPGEGTFDDTSCDGTDDDCDGSEDEEYAPVTTSCGVGACASTAPTTCNMGSVVDHCAPGTPGANDATCNGVDDDCSGQNDEDFVPVCSSTSAQNCVGGAVQSTQCNDDNTCNGTESCNAGSCQSGTAPTQDDGNLCTADSCDPQGGVQHNPLPQGTACGSYKHCNGAGSCVDMPPSITQQPQNVTVNAGQSFSFSVTAQGNGLIYQWQRYRQNISGANASSYSKSAADFSDNNGAYRVFVSNAAGSAVSNEAIVTVTDTVPPVLTVEGPTERSTSLDLITLSGTATDVGVGVTSVAVTSDQFPGQQFGALFNAATTVFDVEVPLLAGVNVLTVIAKDGANNQATQPITVTQVFGSTPVVRIVSPPSGSTVQTAVVDVQGTVASTLVQDINNSRPANEQIAPGAIIRMELGGMVAFPTGNAPPYSFVFEDVRLIRGPNTLVVRAITPEGTVSAESIVTYGEAPTAANEAPRITVAGATSEMFVTTPTLQVNGTVQDDRCVESVTVNGTAANIVGQGTSVTFTATVDLAGASGAVPITVRADDCDDAFATLTYNVTRDDVAPHISPASAQKGPAVNVVAVTPYRLVGSIIDANLAGASANNQSLRLLPGAQSDVWDFVMEVPLSTNVNTTIRIDAWDRAGNASNADIIFDLDAVLDVEVISPTAGTTILVNGPSQTQGVVARIVGINPTDSVFARLNGGTPAQLSLAGATATGSVTLPETSEAHTLTVYVQSATGQVLASKAVNFRTEDADNIVLKVDRVEPANEAVNLETNQFVSLSFSKPIDPAKLNVQLYETAQNGRKFAELAPGADLSTLSEVALLNITRNREPVEGGMSHFPGHTLAAFYPRERFLHGAEVEVVAMYDGALLHKSKFQVRPFPALYYGFLTDTFGRPLSGVEVSLRELGKVSRTDESGYFSFGFGDFVDSIPGGKYRMDFNPGLKSPQLSGVQQWVNIQEKTLNRGGVFTVLRLESTEPYRHLASGAAQVLLDRGNLQFNLSSANLVFTNGASDGDVHAQFTNISALEHPYSVATPLFGYVLNPPGVEVSGTMGVRLSLPTQDGGHGWVSTLPRYVLLLGLDRDALELVPVGVAEVDRVANVVTSVGPTRFGLLDFVGMSVVFHVDQSVFEAYVQGGASLDEVIGAVAQGSQ